MKVRITNNKNIQTMEQKDINIYEILKGVEYGTELYTPMCGNVVFTCLPSNNETIRTEKDLGIYRFDKNGRWMEGGEVMLFPSNEMRDWSKFFKKGDVLICYEGKKPYYTIFDGFESNTYRAFKGKFAYDCCEDKWYQNEGNLSTNTFHKLNREDSEIYVTKIEERFGGKLNRETLEIEKPQPEFKDGDIVMSDSGTIVLVRGISLTRKIYYHAYMRNEYIYINQVEGEFFSRVSRIKRFATDSEKQQLFDALAKEGKRWDSEHKMIVDLKPAFEIGKLYVFREEDEDGELTIIGELIDKNESEDTLTFGNQYEIENEKFVTDQTFDLRISVNKELREATENEVELFNKHYDIWKNGKEQPAFKTFDKVLVRCGKGFKWLPAFFVRDRGEDFASRYNVLPLHSGKAADFTQCIPYEGHENFAFTDYDFVDLPF
jgi:hypothetical protein